MIISLPLILGGHSFISQLGNDPGLDEKQRTDLVAACLDAGITRFDTTYQPERVALGRALRNLGRRDEAYIIAWNFFTPFGPGDDVGGAAAYQPHSLETMLAELQTGRIDGLVVHPAGDPDEDRRQQELAVSWQRDGRIGELGVWNPGISCREIR